MIANDLFRDATIKVLNIFAIRESNTRITEVESKIKSPRKYFLELFTSVMRRIMSW